MLTPARRHGFSLIELLVAVSVIAILMAVAIPNFTIWIRNAQVRAVADALQSSVRLAQAEAQRRNVSVVLFRTTDTACAPNATANASGMHWQLRSIPNPLMTDAADAAVTIQCGSLSETGSQVTLTHSAGHQVLCFSSDGRQTTLGNPAGIGLNCTAGPAWYRVDLNTPHSENRPLRVEVSLSGSVRMCDPGKASTAPDGCRT